MRKTIKTEEIRPGRKALAWEAFCLRKDNIRRDRIPNYNPLELNEETDLMDWIDFNEEWEHGRK